jgi:Tol biopolymer transport system component
MHLVLALLAVAAAPSDRCVPELVSGAPGEGQSMFHGLSPDGRELALGWESGSGGSVRRGAFVLDLQTRKRTDLPHLNNAPSFSPDGRFLVAANYSSDPNLQTEVVELDRKTGETRTYASDPAAEWLASYSHDGKWILFNSMRTGASDLYRVKRSTGQIERLTRGPTYEAQGQFFDRDRKILFHRNVQGDDYDVAIHDMRSGKAISVGATALEEAYPAISRDGRWIAFSAVAAAGEKPNLYVMKPDGTRRTRLTQGADQDAYATWSPDGRYVYFVRFHPEGGRVYRMEMRNGRCTG